MLTKISLVKTINKYFKYLSELPAKNSLGQAHVSGLRLFLSGDSDKYRVSHKKVPFVKNRKTMNLFCQI